MLEAAPQRQNGAGSEERDCGSSLLAEKKKYPLVTDKRKLDCLRLAAFSESDACKVWKRLRAEFVFFAGGGPREDSAFHTDMLHELMKLREHQSHISGA
jgi:hypothetical protein